MGGRAFVAVGAMAVYRRGGGAVGELPLRVGRVEWG